MGAIEEQVGEKGKKAVHYVYDVPKSPYNSLRSLPAVLAYLFPIVPELFPQYEARKGDPQLSPNGDLMQMMSVKNIVFTFLIRSTV